MCQLKNICFVCLTDGDKNLKKVYHNGIEDEIFTHVKCALPELVFVTSDRIPVCICSSCSIAVHSFYMFKKKCLENYSRWKHYIQVLLEHNDRTKAQSSSEFKIKVSDCDTVKKQEDEQGMEENINDEQEETILPSSETEEQISKDLEIKKDDNEPLQKTEPEVHIISKANDIDEPVEEDNTEEEILPDSAAPEYNPQPEFVNVKCEPMSEDELDGDSSVTSEDNNTLNKSKTNSANDNQELKCSVCNEIFTDESIFDNHLRNHIDNITGLNCLICKKMFTKSINLKRHMKLHLGIKDYECSICSKKISRKSALTVHLNLHAGIKDFECEVCHKKFLYKWNLEKHVKTHLGIKDYKCAICNKKYVDSSSLKTHMKYHLDDRNYECTICKKKFVLNSHLQNHMNYHLGIRRYECSVCNKKFVVNDHLKKHLLKQHGITQGDQAECSTAKR